MSRARRDPDSSSHSRATLSRNDPPSSPPNLSLRLTVKMPASKLRAATGGSSRTSGGRPSSGSGRGFAGETRESTRARGVKKSYVVESETEEEDEEMEDLGDEEEEEDAEGEEDEDMDLDEDAEGEEDADGDDDMEMAGLPPPTLKISKPTKEKHSITVKTAGKKDVRVVATTEPSDDEELSDLESEDEEDEETMQVGNDEDAEGEDEEIEVEEEEEEDELDSDEEAGGGSRGSTPDLSKLTKRQRARLDESGSGHLMALPDEVQVKKHLTAEEHAMRRAEMARRRKNLSEKRNEEEKMETINKLLKKQAPKTNARRRDLNGLTGEVGPDGEPGRPNSAYVRWISNKEGNKIYVPTEMVESPAGRLFAGRVVEEV
ncbi:hypothetical protein VC83_03712 [Pseudogymnoascus destructans]|uniref:INO80 complex subunit B-like conserved region domain-containing protein n=1 Tax=Pseudogymnoascus destructans TaxID=655981 RepID=A0A177AE35_9PEZI|nr:uncharacterized protein VC83_03712 [Pseudogymnoascus destructans]OAF59443.2 hypothetical protein VC83_03712 [Pseudogymnoascus destructans]